jgi:hypothetical protein
LVSSILPKKERKNSTSLKFGLFEKHTRFEKKILVVWTFTKQMYKA